MGAGRLHEDDPQEFPKAYAPGLDRLRIKIPGSYLDGLACTVDRYIELVPIDPKRPRRREGITLMARLDEPLSPFAADRFPEVPIRYVFLYEDELEPEETP